MITGPLAIFDLDRTMHAGSGLGVLARHAFRSRLISSERMARSLVHDLVFRKGGSGDSHINSIAELALDMAGGVSLDDLAPVLEATAVEIAESVRPAMRAVLELHRADGHYNVLLSASPQTLVVRIGELLGFDIGIGTVIETAEGKVTGSIVPPMCYGLGKLQRLQDVIGWSGGPVAGIDTDFDTWAYADSMSDLPILEAVTVPFAVVPDRKLRKVAEERTWTVLDV